MRSDDLSGPKSKRVCKDIPNLVLITKSTTPGYIQVTYEHASVGNKAFVKTVTAFSLARSLQVPTVVLIGIKRAFAVDGEKILLLTMEVLLHTTTGDLKKSSKLRNWTFRNAILLPKFLTKTVVTNGETAEEDLLKIFAENIKADEMENAPEESNSNEGSRYNENNNKAKSKKNISKRHNDARRDVWNNI